ncbi:MAG: HipA domain-containing protein [Pseudomonadota bacterium]
MKLTVWIHERRVGTLAYDIHTARFVFDYAQEWLIWNERFPLAPSLPFQHLGNELPDQHSAAVRQFFQNLLPEGQALEDAARANKISKANVLGLLQALGKETTGALRITLEGERPHTTRAQPRLLLGEELSERIRRRPELPFSIWDGKIRLSIAGYQDKLAVFEHKNQWFLVEDEALASTLILKPEPVSKTLTGMTTNELMCMTLARSIGLPVASAYLKHVPEPVLVIERFDRKVVPSATGEVEVERRHCIDGCQTLGLSVDFKYERPYGDGRDVKDIRDGASLQRFFTLLQDTSKVPVTAAAQLEFLRWVIFQVLIGNTDAHAKNVSFFCGADGLRLTPAYDLVCGLAFAPAGIEDSLAMAIGDNFDPLKIQEYNWAQLAFENRLAPRLVANELARLAKACLNALPGVLEILEKQSASAEMARLVSDVVGRQCKNALVCAPGIARIYDEQFKTLV